MHQLIKHSFKGLRRKLLFFSFSLMVFLLIENFLSYQSLNQLQNVVREFSSVEVPSIQALGNVKASSQAAPRNLWLALAYDADEGQRATYIDRTFTHIESLKTKLGQIKIKDGQDEQKRAVESLKNAVNDLEKILPTIIEKLNKNTKEEDLLARTIMMTDIPPITSTISDNVEGLSLAFEKSNEDLIKASESNYQQTVTKNWVVVIAIVMIFTVLSLVMASKLVRDFSNITERVNDASSHILSTSEDMSEVSGQLSNESQMQASALEQSTSALTELTSVVDNNVKTSEAAAGYAEEIHAFSHETRKLMDQLNGAMGNILESNKKIENLVRIISEIGEKTEIIDDIVFKTQLLSFNASVEAERAGEHGRGFAVVAQEVGNLAQLSGTAATQIAAIVKSSMKEAESVSKDNKDKVLMGDKLVAQTQKQINQVISKIENVMNSNKQILMASKEQLSGIQQISETMHSLNNVTQKSAHLAVRSSTSGDVLKDQSGNLIELVDELSTIVHGFVKIMNYKNDEIDESDLNSQQEKHLTSKNTLSSANKSAKRKAA